MLIELKLFTVSACDARKEDQYNVLFSYREREEVMKDTTYDIDTSNRVVTDEAAIASSVNDAGKPEVEAENKMDDKAASEEEFDCSSVTVSSEGERKIAALEEKSRRLKAQFAEENKLAIESMNKIREEIKQSQEREDIITNDMKEMRKRQEEIKDDLKRLDEIAKTRERNEKKWKEKIDKKKNKIARRLEKVRAGRLKYQQEIEAENENSENQDHPVTQLKNEENHHESKESKDLTAKNTSCSNEDPSNEILYEPHEVKEYSSVKELEKKRKELRRLEKMEKKAIKREKLERKERKKIEKEKRKVARKLEKMSTRKSKLTQEKLESSDCVNNQTADVASPSPQEKSEEPQNVNQTEQDNIPSTATCDGDEKGKDASNKACDQERSEGDSSLHLHEVQKNATSEETPVIENEQSNTPGDAKKTPVAESKTSVPEVPELGSEKARSAKQKSFKFEKDNNPEMGSDGFVKEELEKKPSSESVKEKSETYNKLDKQQKHIYHDNQMEPDEDVWDDVEIECSEKEDTLKDVSVELFSIEEELDYKPKENLEGEDEPEERHLLSDEACSLQGEIVVDEQCTNDNRAVFSYTAKELTSELGTAEILDICSSEREASRGSDEACVQLENQPDILITNIMDSAQDSLDEVSVSSEMAQQQIPPKAETMTNTNFDFDQHDGGCKDSDEPVQCVVYDHEEICADVEDVSTPSKEKQPQDGYLDGSEVIEERLDDEHSDIIDMALESDESCGNNDPDDMQSSSPVTNQPSPLVRKPSGRFTSRGLQPFFYSPEIAEGDPIFEDMDSSSQEVEENVQSEDWQVPFEENSTSLDYEEVVQDLKARSNNDEANSCRKGYDTTLNDLPSEMQDALLQLRDDSTGEEVAENIDTEIIYEEESRRPSGPDLLSVVYEETSIQDCDQEDLLEQGIEAGSEDMCIKESFSNDEYQSIFVEGEDADIPIVETPVDVCETKPNEKEANDGLNHLNAQSDSIDGGVIGPAQSKVVARESLPEGSSPLHTPQPIALMEEDENSSALPEELEQAISVEAAAVPTNLEMLANSDQEKRSPRTTRGKDVFKSRIMANNISKEDAFIVAFDDFLDEFEEVLEMEKNMDGTTAEQPEVCSPSDTLREKENLSVNHEEENDENESSLDTASKSLANNVACGIAVQDNINEDGRSHSFLNTTDKPDSLGSIHDLLQSDCSSEKKKFVSEDVQKDKATEILSGPNKDENASIKLSPSNEVIDDDVEMSIKQAPVDVCESKLETSENKANDGRDHLNIDNIDEGVTNLEQLKGTARESLSEGSSALHTPQLLASTADDANNSELPKEPVEAVPVKTTVVPSTSLEAKANSDHQKHSPRTNDGKYVFKSQTTANSSSKEDDFIAEFDDFLDEVEESLDMEGNIDGKTTEQLEVLSPSETLKEREKLSVTLEEDNEEKDSSLDTASEPVANLEVCPLEIKDDINGNIEVENPHLLPDTTDKPVSSGSLHDLFQPDFHSAKTESATDGVKEDESTENSSGRNKDKTFYTGLLPSHEVIHEENTISLPVTNRDFLKVDGEEPRSKNEEKVKESPEHDASTLSVKETSTSALCQSRNDSPPPLLETPSAPALPQSCNDSLPSSGSNDGVHDKIMVVAGQVKPPSDENQVDEVNMDDDVSEGLDDLWGSFYDLAPPTTHEDISMHHIDEDVVEAVFRTNVTDSEQAVLLHINTSRENSCEKDNKTSASDAKGSAGDDLLSVDSKMDQSLDVTLEDVSSIDEPSTEVRQLSRASKTCLPDKEKSPTSKPNEDEFIDDFDRLLDEVEEDIRIEESLSSSISNPQSSVTNKTAKENYDESNAWVGGDTLDESFTSITDVESDESLLSSCDVEVAAIDDAVLQAISEEGEEPDSWDALDELVVRRFRNRESTPLQGAFGTYEEEDRLSAERWRMQYEQSIARIADLVNISEYLLHQELFGAFEAAIWDKDVLEEQINLCASSPKSGTSSITKDCLPNNDTLDGTKGVVLASQATCVSVPEETATVAEAIEELNKVHLRVADMGRQLFGRTGNKVETYSAKIEVGSVPVLLDSIRLLDGNIEDLAEEFKHGNEKSNIASKNREADVQIEIEKLRTENAKILEESRKENAELLDQITVIQEEVEGFKKRNKALQAELEVTRVDLDRVQSSMEYKERELTNLKNDFERKATKWEEAEERLDNAVSVKDELLDDVEYLEDSLRVSRERNEELNARVEEMNETMEELKKEIAMINKRHEYGHLREEVELLKGSLELCNHREKLLRCQVDSLETEVSHFKNREQTFKSELETLKDEKSMIINQLKEKLATAEIENARMIAELSSVSDKDKMFNDLKDENMRNINQLEDKLVKLTEENSTLTTELSKALDTNNELTELRDEASRVINDLEDQLAELKKENFTLSTELSKVAEKDKKLAELRKENSALTTEVAKGSEKYHQLTEQKNETSRIKKQFEDEIAKLRKENSRLTMQLSKASEKDEQLAELEKENSRLTAERSKATDKAIELTKLRDETSRVIKHLEHQLSKLGKENSMLTTELTNVAEKEKLLAELREEVENLKNQNKFLQEEALEAKKRFVNELQSPQEEVSEVWEDSMRSRRSHGRKNSDIKMLRRRVRQNEQEIEFLGRFIRQRGLTFEDRPRYNIDQDLKDEPSGLVNVKNPGKERDLQRESQVQEMEKVIEDLRKSLQQTESDLEQLKSALTLKTERTDLLESRVEEKEMLLEETSKRLKQNEHKLQQTETTLRVQLDRVAKLENQIQEMERLGETAITSVMSKQQELEEACGSIKKKDEKIDDLIHELKQERLDNECLKRAIEVTECNYAAKEKGLLEKTRDLENKLQRMEELKETTLASLMDKEQELKQVYRNLNSKDVEIDALMRNLKQERSDKDCLKRTITASECNAIREKGLLERIAELEKQLKDMEELKEKTLASLKDNERALERASARTGDLKRELKREKSDKESLRKVVEVMECNAKRGKERLEETRAQLEYQLRDMEKLQETTQKSLKSKEQELQQAYSSISRKDIKIDDLTEELNQERFGKKELRKAMELSKSNADRQRLLLDDKEQEVERLNKLLCDYERKTENSNAYLEQMRKELETAEELLTYKQNNVGNKGISSRIQYDGLEVFSIRRGKNTENNSREIGFLMGHVSERLRKLLQRQKEMNASATILKQKEAEMERAVERFRGEVNQRDDEVESLKSSLGKSVNEVERTRSRLREVELENIDLKRSLGDEGDKVKRLELTVKQLEGDLQRTQNSLKEKETTLEETKESLQLKGSLLASLEGKLCLRDRDIEKLTLVNKERAFELERVERSLKEVKKELEISTSIITKQNEELIYLKSSAQRKMRDAEGKKHRVGPAQDDLKLLSIRLERARNEKSNLSRELAAATARLENEQVLADSQKKALQEQVNSGLEDLKTKTKVICSMKLSLQESTARITRLEAEKLQQERCLRNYKRKMARESKLVKQSQSSADEDESLLQSWVGSTESEMSEISEVKRENQGIDVRKEIGELSQNGPQDTSTELLKVRHICVLACPLRPPIYSHDSYPILTAHKEMNGPLRYRCSALPN